MGNLFNKLFFAIIFKFPNSFAHPISLLHASVERYHSLFTCIIPVSIFQPLPRYLIAFPSIRFLCFIEDIGVKSGGALGEGAIPWASEVKNAGVGISRIISLSTVGQIAVDLCDRGRSILRNHITELYTQSSINNT